MNGQLSEQPLAELIREIATARLTGALRLERERVKVVVYFEAGEIVYATSNLRIHRLGEVLKRCGLLTEKQLASLGQKSDGDLAAALLSESLVQRADLDKMRLQQVSDVLRPALLWIDGQWSYDARVRLTDEMRTKFNSRLLLMECARRLPQSFIAARFKETSETFSRLVGADSGISLLPAEAFLFSRVDAQLSLNELKALSGLRDAEALRVAYALALGGLLQRSGWSNALAPSDGQKAGAGSGELKQPAAASPAASAPVKAGVDEAAAARAKEERQLKAMLVRVSQAEDHYEVLDVGRGASMSEIKRAYHSLARSFHPDKFHKIDSRDLHGQLESAFARFAQAYETLGDVSLRSAYDAKLGIEQTAARGPQSSGRIGENPRAASTEKNPSVEAKPESPERSRAERRFQQGLEALEQKDELLAVRCFAEAAQFAPGVARYRAHHGSALITQPQARRLAESELQAAISLDSENASYRVMLARLYEELGFFRRAQTELERALALEPGNEAAHQLLRTLSQYQSN